MRTKIIVIVLMFMLMFFFPMCGKGKTGGDTQTGDNRGDRTKTDENTITLSIPPENLFMGKHHKKIFGEALGRLGYTLKTVNLPYGRAPKDTDEGLIDGFSPSSDKAIMDFSNIVKVDEPIHSASVAVYSLDSGIKILGMDDIKDGGYTVAYPRGMQMIEKAAQAVLKAENIYEFDSNDQGVQMLLAKRMDLLLLPSDEDIGLGTDAAKGVHKAGDINKVDLYPFLNIKFKNTLAPKLAATLKEMKQDGTFQKLIAQVIEELK